MGFTLHVWQSDKADTTSNHLQLGLELELGALELQQRLLHADGGKQHKVLGACRACRL